MSERDSNSKYLLEIHGLKWQDTYVSTYRREHERTTGAAEMTDRELLELAAKAAGIDGKWVDGQSAGWFVASNGRPWEPLLDDGDALRLAIDCGLSIEPYPYYSTPKHSVIVKQRRRGDQMRETNPTEVVEVYGDDPYAATRRAIVRAAAEIGRALK